MAKYRFELPSINDENIEKIGKSIENFKNEIILMSLTIAQTDKIFKLTESVVDTYSEVIKTIVPATETKSLINLNFIHRRLKETLEKNDTNFKRNQAKKKYPSFVEPEEKALGFKWTQTFDQTSGKIVRKYTQNTFQFLRPSSIIQALFSNPNFIKMYIENVIEKKGHVCEDGVYKDYCSGTNFGQSDFFKTNPSALQLQLYTDNSDPCDALKSKAGIHKKCAFYMIIRNMPRKFQSKLSNIFLVALADSNNFKSESASINSILEVIVEDLKMLETVGIEVANHGVIKSCLIVMCSDNLGFNICFGLAQGFSAHYFCRFCLCSKSECKHMTKENPNKLRNIESYKKICDQIIMGDISSSSETNGIREYCRLNDLSNFHIFKNYAVDPMHDLLEGVVPFALHRIFEYCLKKKIFDLSQLRNMIQFYNYGVLNKRNIPSKLKIDSRNLGQNATQLCCLILNIPFILYPYKNDLLDVWTLIQSLLKILEIIFSSEISENDLLRLEIEIDRHTNFILNFFKKDLIPKHHFMVHYPTVIRTMGPVIFTSVMRLEAKHQELKAFAQKTNNFRNLNKTIAEKHQTLMCLKEHLYRDQIENGLELGFFGNTEDYEKYQSCEPFTFNGKELMIKSLKINNLEFKPGQLLLPVMVE